MKFQVSARKWRPQKFTELIGQEHIVQTLRNAIELNRIAHAYLFSGTRGVGKTTTARILAKALNCEKGPTIDPCDQCPKCIEIREGRNLDVLEIDGASNTGVAEVRDLIENVQYSTTSCRYKVYIIDEVHMLSKSAFNALLKTLEEPPPQVVFIFATTELIKIPETILSRCQCFEFKALSQMQIVEQLELITKQEKIKIDKLSLEEIAKNGAGSMRDSQSLLDQVIAFCGKEVDPGSVESILGVVGQKELTLFIDYVVQKNAVNLLEQVQRIIESGKDLGYFCRDLLEYLRSLMVVKLTSNSAKLLEQFTFELDPLIEQAKQLDKDQLQQMFNVLVKTEWDMKRSSQPKIIFEMAVLQLLEIRPFQEIDHLIERINSMEPENSNSSLPEGVPLKKNLSETKETQSSLVQESFNEPNQNLSSAEKLWSKIRERAVSRKRAFDHFLANCELIKIDDSEVHLRFADPYTLGLMEKEENLSIIQEVVQELCGVGLINVKLDHGKTKYTPESSQTNKEENVSSKSYDKETSPSEDEILKDAMDIFGGMIIR